MVLFRQYSVTTVGASSVTLTPITQAAAQTGADPGALGTGTVVVNTTVTPSATVWVAGHKWQVTFESIQ